MVNWSEPLVMQQAFEGAIALFWVSVGFSIREQMTTSYFDWDVIVGRRQRRWPQSFFFLVKVTWWVYVTLNIYFVWTTKEIDCQKSIYAIEAMMGIITVCCSVLLACRTICVYQDTPRKVVIGFVTIFAMGLAAAWGEGITSVSAVWVPGGGKPWTEGACAFTSVRTTYSVKYIVTMAFDLTALLLTVYGVFRLEGSSTKIGHILIKQGIVYFIVTCVVNALITGFTIAQLNPVMSLILAVPTSAIAVAASTRLYVDLAEETRPSKDREVTFSRENEESYFGTSSGMTSDTRKQRSLMGMFRKTSSASGIDSEKLPHVLPITLIPSSPLVGVHTSIPSHSVDGQVYMAQTLSRHRISHDQQRPHGRTTAEDDMENMSSPIVPASAAANADSAESGVRRSRASMESIPSGCVTPCGTSVHRIHRKQPSLSVLPSAAAAAANLRIEESQTVTTEPMPVHLRGHPFGSTASSSTHDEAVAKEFPTLSKSSHGHGQ
ncbi:hypothetical protein CF319_g4322 [Tilletia indica]|nr:hypothetical protein CF319_g4322 [Tilletia indica]